MAANGPQPLTISAIDIMFSTSTVLSSTSFRKYLKIIDALDDVYLTNYAEKHSK